MSSDYEFSDDEGDYYDDGDMMDTQEDEDGKLQLQFLSVAKWFTTGTS